MCDVNGFDGKSKPYYHGETSNAIATINIEYNFRLYKYNNVKNVENYELLSSEDIDDYIKKIEEEKNEKTKRKKSKKS